MRGWLRLAQIQGKSLQEVLRANTWREYRLWMLFLQEEMSEPDRSDYYLMQVCSVIQGMMSKKKTRKRKLSDYRIKFKHGKPKRKKKTKKEIAVLAAQAKQRWFGRIGYDPNGKVN